MNEHGSLSQEEINRMNAYASLLRAGKTPEQAQAIINAGAKVRIEKPKIIAPNIPKTQKGQVLVARNFRGDDSYEGPVHTVSDDNVRNARKEAHVIAEDSSSRPQRGESIKATKAHVHPKGDHSTGHFTPIDGNRGRSLASKQLREERRKTQTLREERRNSGQPLKPVAQLSKNAQKGWSIFGGKAKGLKPEVVTDVHEKAQAVEKIKKDPKAQGIFAKLFGVGNNNQSKPQEQQKETKQAKQKKAESQQNSASNTQGDVLIQENKFTGKKTYRKPDGSTYTIR